MKPIMGEVAARQFHKPHFWALSDPHAKFTCPTCNRHMNWQGFAPLHGMRHGKRSGNYLYPHCRMCLKERQSRLYKHPLFTSEVFRYWNRQFNSVKAGARTRGRDILVYVDADDLIDIYLQQGGLCAYTGIKLSIGKKFGLIKDPTSASVDRIDSSKHYSYDNIAIVCARVNVMKGDATYREFHQWCRLVLHHQIAMEDALSEAVE
jgi:hypothetical protein